MSPEAIHQEVEATLTKVKQRNAEFSKSLDKAYGYAVFPAIGRASAVLGGAYGHGEVFERGERIGQARISQVTLGVQLGGQTFAEIVKFNSKDALDRFRRGRVAFEASGSAVIIKAAASGTTNYEKDVEAKAFSEGGMLLETAIGIQSFKFIPPEHLGRSEQQLRDDEEQEREAEQAQGEQRAHEGQALQQPGGDGANEPEREAAESEAAESEAAESEAAGSEVSSEEESREEEPEAGGSEGHERGGRVGRAARRVYGKTAAKVADTVKGRRPN